jgi:hypothetical protein
MNTEKDALKNLAKLLGVESVFEQIEAKKAKEEKILEDLRQTLGIKIESKQAIEDPELEVPMTVIEEPEKSGSDIVIEAVEKNEEVLIVENPVAPMPELPLDTIVTKTVKSLYQGEPKNIQKEVDKIPDLLQREIDAMKKTITDLHSFAKRQSQMGGGGEVNLRYLDDVDAPTIYDMRFLRYNESKKLFEFAEVNPHDIVYTTYLVTTPTYTVNSDDYYVGVNYAGPTTIILPSTLHSSGRMIIIKDESGNAEINPITVVGNVDNDAGGFIIQINNGGVQLLYRNGWRIV